MSTQNQPEEYSSWRRFLQLLAHCLVVGIIAFFGFSLFKAAVQKVRDSIERTICEDNMRNLVFGIQSNATMDPNRHFGIAEPTPAFLAGTISHPTLPPEQRLSWIVAILPQIHYEFLYDTFNRCEPFDSTTNLQTGRIYINTSTCIPAKSDISQTNYVGVAGVGLNAATLPDSDPKVGIFGYDRRTAIDGVSDGLSNTLLLLETNSNVGLWAKGGPDTVRGLDPATVPYIGRDRSFGGIHINQYGCNAAMADGSIRRIRESVSPTLLESLATIHGNEQIPSEW